MHDEAKSEVAMPIGPGVDGTPARRPGRTTLPGRVVTLAPLAPQAHGDALYEGTRGEAGDRLFQVRRGFPATHDRQGKKSGYRVVLHARFRMARPKGELRALA